MIAECEVRVADLDLLSPRFEIRNEEFHLYRYRSKGDRSL